VPRHTATRKVRRIRRPPAARAPGSSGWNRPRCGQKPGRTELQRVSERSWSSVSESLSRLPASRDQAAEFGAGLSVGSWSRQARSDVDDAHDNS
jgi:hypothetical protein